LHLAGSPFLGLFFHMAASDLFDVGTAPPWLADALRGGNVELSLRAACKTASTADLHAAYAAIYPGYPTWRSAVQMEIDKRRSEEASQAAERRHQESLFASRRAFRLAVLAIVIALISLAIAATQFVGWRP
jgi:anti-sigma-K factor RskA